MRETVKAFLREQLKQVPTREVCRHLAKEDLQVIAQYGLRFEPVEAFLEANSLFFTAGEISDLWFQLVLYFMLNTKRYENAMVYYDDARIWDLADDATAKRLQKTKELMEIGDEEIALTELDQFLAYVQLEKADF